jgi:hypothetical protein
MAQIWPICRFASKGIAPKQRISTLFVLVPFEMYAALDGVGDKDRLDRKGNLTGAIARFYEDR